MVLGIDHRIVELYESIYDSSKPVLVFVTIKKGIVDSDILSNLIQLDNTITVDDQSFESSTIISFLTNKSDKVPKTKELIDRINSLTKI